MKKIVIPTVVATLLWMAMDFLIHGNLLHGLYEKTASVWRPMESVDPVLCTVMMVLFALAYVAFYNCIVSEKSVKEGLHYGLGVGVILGIAMASFYVYLPIPSALAIAWFVASVVESAIVGAAIGFLTRD